MDATVQIRQDGSFTLPAALRARYDIRPGDTFRVVDLDGVLVLSLATPVVARLAEQIERARVDAGLETADLLRALRDERTRYTAETYPDRSPSDK